MLLTRSVIGPPSPETGAASFAWVMESVQPGLGCGLAVMMLSGMVTVSAVVGEPAQPWLTLKPAMNVVPALAFGLAMTTCAAVGRAATPRRQADRINSLRIMNLQHECPLRERMEEEIFVVVQIVDAGGDAPIVVPLVMDARIRHQIAAETLIGLRHRVGIVDGAEGAVAIARRQSEGEFAVVQPPRPIGRHRVAAQLGKLRQH